MAILTVSKKGQAQLATSSLQLLQRDSLQSGWPRGQTWHCNASPFDTGVLQLFHLQIYCNDNS